MLPGLPWLTAIPDATFVKVNFAPRLIRSTVPSAALLSSNARAAVQRLGEDLTERMGERFAPDIRVQRTACRDHRVVVRHEIRGPNGIIRRQRQCVAPAQEFFVLDDEGRCRARFGMKGHDRVPGSLDVALGVDVTNDQVALGKGPVLGRRYR
jgi:hypothetical protein